VIVAGASIILTPALAGENESFAPSRIHYNGLLNDYTPSAAVVKGGPYEMRGAWSLDVNQRRGSAIFSAEMNMETSDYGITQNTVNKDDPTTRGAHTHHISMTDGVVADDWTTACPALSPAATDGFVITGTVFVTGNGSSAPFGNPSPVTSGKARSTAGGRQRCGAKGRSRWRERSNRLRCCDAQALRP
jgi:hypothetical protein